MLLFSERMNGNFSLATRCLLCLCITDCVKVDAGGCVDSRVASEGFPTVTPRHHEYTAALMSIHGSTSLLFMLNSSHTKNLAMTQRFTYSMRSGLRCHKPLKPKH